MIPPADPDAIVAAVRRHIDDPAAARAMAERAHGRFTERFTTSQMLRQYQGIFERLARPGLLESATGV